ncbi:MAG: hypothetical protein R3C45_18230 [Phycisphaerales bacterium]
MTRTRDGGKTFDTLTKGPPQNHAYDIAPLSRLAVDETGDRLLVGSTTGSVWSTKDQGDAWTLADVEPAVDQCGTVRVSVRITHIM